MDDQSPANPDDVSDALNRVNSLGTATERIFSRLYRGLTRRSKAPEVPQAPSSSAIQVAELAQTREQNRYLKLMLEQRAEELTRLNGILASLDEGIIMQNMEGRIVLINEAARRLLGGQKNFWSSELGTLFDAYHEVTQVDSELAPLGEPTRIQVNNRILGAQLAAVADNTGQRLGTMIVLRDVTRDALAERLKDGFITHISHELKTPMTVIKGMGEVLANQPEGKPINHRLLETLGRNVDILDRMVVELLDISEISAENFDIRQDLLHVDEIVWSVIRGLTPELNTANTRVVVMVKSPDTLQVVGDDQRLRWAMGHLIRNSIYYSLPGGQIIIELVESQSGLVEIRVTDNGVGISDKDLPHIFERFYRGEPRTQAGKRLDPRGLGQGLFVAKTVAEAHHGYIGVRTEPGYGSTFTLNLPLADSA